MWQKAQLLNLSELEHFAGSTVFVLVQPPMTYQGVSARTGQYTWVDRGYSTNVVHPFDSRRRVAMSCEILELLGIFAAQVELIPWAKFSAQTPSQGCIQFRATDGIADG